MLYAGADVSDYAATGRFRAEADFAHSAGYELIPVAGLNTTGASGHNFLAAPVPEPGTWALMAGGLLAPAAGRALVEVAAERPECDIDAWLTSAGALQRV